MTDLEPGVTNQSRRIAEKFLAAFPTCPIPEIRRLGKPSSSGAAFLAYFDTGRASDGGTEAINGLIEVHRRIAPFDCLMQEDITLLDASERQVQVR
jgi:hypothetical protein